MTEFDWKYFAFEFTSLILISMVTACSIILLNFMYGFSAWVFVPFALFILWIILMTVIHIKIRMNKNQNTSCE